MGATESKLKNSSNPHTHPLHSSLNYHHHHHHQNGTNTPSPPSSFKKVFPRRRNLLNPNLASTSPHLHPILRSRIWIPHRHPSQHPPPNPNPSTLHRPSNHVQNLQSPIQIRSNPLPFRDRRNPPRFRISPIPILHLCPTNPSRIPCCSQTSPTTTNKPSAPRLRPRRSCRPSLPTSPFAHPNPHSTHLCSPTLPCSSPIQPNQPPPPT